MKNPILKFAIFAFLLIFILSTCSQWKGEWPDEPEFVINDEDVIFKMKFTENEGWDRDGNEEWGRWMYVYDNNINPFNLSGFDLSGMLADNKVYTFEYSFYSDIDINSLGIYFYTDNPNWQMLSNWTEIKSNIKKNNIYKGKIIIIPKVEATGCPPNNIHLRFDINNRGVSDPAVLSFYKFTADQIDREIEGISVWDVSGETFRISDVSKTFAEILPDFENKSNVLHIRPTYGAKNYSGSVIQYDLSEYEGKKIEIEMSMFVYLKGEARIAWQINSTDPFYPVICGTVAPDWRLPDNSGPPLNANEWIYITGKNTIIVPYTGNAGKILYLSGQQIEGKEAYFANAEIKITEGLNEEINFINVTADGNEWETTTWLTLTFDKEIPGLGVSDISFNGVNGATGRMLSGEGPEYKLLISGFTSSGELTVEVRKAGFTINDSQKTVYIYYHPTFTSLDGLKGLTTDEGEENETKVDTERGIIYRDKNDDWDRWFSIAIPSSQLPIIASDTIIIKYIAVSDKPIPMVPRMPNSTIELISSFGWDNEFLGDETVQTFEIEAYKYGASLPINVVTFQNSQGTKGWKLKIIDITKKPGLPIKINLPLSDIRRPVAGKTPLKTINNHQYSGTISWPPNTSTFTNGTAYTATISLTCKAGYTFDGIAANGFKVIGAANVTHTAGAGNKMTITAAFPAAASAPAPAKNITFSAGDVMGYGVKVDLSGNTGFTITNNTIDQNWDWAYPYFRVKFDGSYTLSDYTKIEITVNPLNVGWKPVRIAAYNYNAPPPTGSLSWYNANVIAAKEDGNPIAEAGKTKTLTFDITAIPPDADLDTVYIAICIPSEPGARYIISNIRFYN
jgi:hypothetical protein